MGCVDGAVLMGDGPVISGTEGCGTREWSAVLHRARARSGSRLAALLGGQTAHPSRRWDGTLTSSSSGAHVAQAGAAWRSLGRRPRKAARRGPWLLAACPHAALVVGVVGVALVLIWCGLAGLAGADEAAAIRTELREAGYLVGSVELLPDSAIGAVAGREGLSVPEGARLYRVSFRWGAGESYREAYRLVAGPLGDQWAFPIGSATGFRPS